MSTFSIRSTFADVAEVLHAAITLGPAAWGREHFPEAHMASNIEDSLRSDLTRLFAVLHQRKLPYVLVGVIAILTYVEGRNTKDVDLVLSVESIQLLPELVLSAQSADFARGTFGTLRVDVLLTTNPLFKLVDENHTTIHPFLETNVRCATVEGLILLKLYALPSLYRQGDGQRIGLYENDVFMLCQQHRPKITPILETLVPYVDQGQLEELTNIMSDIQRRIDRIDRAKRK